MLRLEKRAYGKGIAIGMRDRAPFFTKQLKVALFAALAAHGLALALFSIRTIFVPPLDPIRETVVIVDRGSAIADRGMIPTLERNRSGLLPRRVDRPTQHLPSIPQFSGQHLSRWWTPLQASAVEDVASVDTNLLDPIPTHQLFDLYYTPVRLSATGELAALALHLDSDLILPRLRLGTTTEATAIVEVRVEGRTGRICWHNLKTPAPQVDIDHLLAHLSFEKDPSTLLYSGEIEFTFEYD